MVAAGTYPKCLLQPFFIQKESSMLSESQTSVLKYICGKPPIKEILPPSLGVHGRRLTPADLSAPRPAYKAPNLDSPNYIAALQQGLRKHLTGMTPTAGSPHINAHTLTDTNSNADAKAFLRPEGLIVEDAEILNKLNSSKLSPSLVMSLYGCAASMVTQRYAWKFGLDTESVEQVRGSAFHEVFEKLLALPPASRTLLKAYTLAENSLKHPKYSLVSKDPEQVQWLKDTIRKAFSIRRAGEDPTTPEETELCVMPDGKLALEVPLSGKIGGATRETFGIADRIIEDTDGAWVIQDYKTGAKMKKYTLTIRKRSGEQAGETIPRLPEPVVDADGLQTWRMPDGFKEAFQQYSYLLLAEQNRIPAERAELLFPAVDAATNVAEVPPLLSTINEPTPEAVAFDAWVKDAYTQADQKITELTETGIFPYSPSFLCSWCPLAKMCPKFQAHTGKGTEAYKTQPDAIPHIAPLSA